VRAALLGVAAALVTAALVFMLLQSRESEQTVASGSASLSGPAVKAASDNTPSAVAAPAALVPVPSAASASSAGDPYVEVKQDLSSGRAILIDAREMADWDKGHLDGAIIFPTSWLEGYEEGNKPNTIPLDKVIYVYASTAAKANRATALLSNMGFDARPFEHGFSELAGSFDPVH
jgi:phage shock protein E